MSSASEIAFRRIQAVNPATGEVLRELARISPEREQIRWYVLLRGDPLQHLPRLPDDFGLEAAAAREPRERQRSEIRRCPSVEDRRCERRVLLL